MIDLLEMEVEIARNSNYQGSALSGACVPCKTCVWAEKMCRNRRKKFWFKRKGWCMTAITSASPKAVVLAGMLSMLVGECVQI